MLLGVQPQSLEEQLQCFHGQQLECKKVDVRVYVLDVEANCEKPDSYNTKLRHTPRNRILFAYHTPNTLASAEMADTPVLTPVLTMRPQGVEL